MTDSPPTHPAHQALDNLEAIRTTSTKLLELVNQKLITTTDPEALAHLALVVSRTAETERHTLAAAHAAVLLSRELAAEDEPEECNDPQCIVHGNPSGRSDA